MIERPEDTEKILDAFAAQYGIGAVNELKISLFRLRATSPVVHPELASHKICGQDPEQALKGYRDVYWKDDTASTAIYAQSKLDCGNIVRGPAVIESDDTTILVPAGKKYTVDGLLNGVIEPA